MARTKVSSHFTVYLSPIAAITSRITTKLRVLKRIVPNVAGLPHPVSRIDSGAQSGHHAEPPVESQSDDVVADGARQVRQLERSTESGACLRSLNQGA